MAAQYTQGKFIVYNWYNNTTTPYTAGTLSPIYGDAVWVYGYIIGG